MKHLFTLADQLMEAKAVRLGVAVKRRYTDAELAESQKELDDADARYYERLESADDPDEEEDAPGICRNCNGSGMGQTDNTNCGVCHGSGEY